jgi:NDP-sugar pyrophosphorylase family protein
VLPIVGKPFLFYQLELLKRVEVRDIVLSLSYPPQKIEDVFGDGSHAGVRLSYIVEPQPLGTAGAYRSAYRKDGEPAIVLNGDILADVDLSRVLAFHRDRKAAVTIVLSPVAEPRAYGIVETDDEGRVQRFLEKPEEGETTSKTINAGIYVIEPSVLDHMGSAESISFEYDLFPALLREGVPVFGFTSDRYWLDIGTPPRYLRANLDVLAGKLDTLPKPERATGERVDERASVDGVSWIDPSATIKAGASVVNSVVEANCVVEEKAVVESCLVRRSTRIGSFAAVRDSVVGMSCHVGRYAVVGGVALGDKSVLTDYTAAGDLA